jgi:hypothetical protein
MAKKGFWRGMAGMVLVSGLVLMGCGDETSLAAISASSLSGSTWVAEEQQDMSEMGGSGTIKTKSTITFTGADKGTLKNEVTDWGGMPAEMQSKLKQGIEAANGDFTYSYTSSAGAITAKDNSTLNFTVDVAAKKLIVTDGDGETTEYKQTA